MRQYEAQVDIIATPSVIWRTLDDIAGYADWSPLIAHVSPDAKAARDATFSLRLARVPLNFQATITTYRPERTMSWQLHLRWQSVQPTISRTLTPLTPERTRYTIQVTLKGALLPLFAPVIDRVITPLYIRECLALKAKVEAQTP